MTAKEIAKMLEADGWYEMKGGKTGHRQFKHDQKSGKVTVPMHPGEVPFLTVKSIEKQAGLKFKR